MKVPELLSPAGSFEKLKTAIYYGANALYLGGQQFGLRSAAQNFTDLEILQACEYAHERGVKIYVVLNSFVHERDMESLSSFIHYLESCSVDAVIASDLGVISLVKEISNLPIHLSTQASCVNSYSAKLWRNLGVERVILGRECSLEEAKKIKELSGLEVEMFIHGSMCMAYSGNCVISNFTQGRDSNRGGCAHSCRFEYSLDFEDDPRESYRSFFMSSKDLMGLRYLQDFLDAGIDSIKVEGRMKGDLYAATTAMAYSKALKLLQEKKTLDERELSLLRRELEKVVHRDYAPVNLKEKADHRSVYDERETDDYEYIMIGKILDLQDGFFILEVKNAFNLGDTLEILTLEEVVILKIEQMSDLFDKPLERTKPSHLAKIPLHKSFSFLKSGQIVRMMVKKND